VPRRPLLIRRGNAEPARQRRCPAPRSGGKDRRGRGQERDGNGRPEVTMTHNCLLDAVTAAASAGCPPVNERYGMKLWQVQVLASGRSGAFAL